MLEAPLISIIIPVYNSQHIESCLESCVKQSIGIENLEIIVFNDASTDNTAERVSEFSQTHPVNLITSSKNIGPAAARNAGLKVARGEFIAFLDSDDMMRADKLEKQVAFCRQHPTIQAVISGIEEIDENDSTIRNLIRTFSHDPNTQAEIIFLDNLHTITSTLLFKRSLLDSSGYMNPELLNLEDMEFALKLLQHTTMHYYAECLTIRRILNSGLSYSVSESIFLESRTLFFEAAISMHPFLQELRSKYWYLNYARLGRVLQRQGNWRKARHYYKQSIMERVNLIGTMGYVLSYFPSSMQTRLAGRVWKSN